MNKQLYKKGQIGKFVGAVCTQYKLNPDEVTEFLLFTFPELQNKEKCVNCKASMAIYEHRIDTLDALLLVGMGKIVDNRLKAHIPFTEANKVHVQSELNKYYSVPSRTSWCAKLGLVSKVLKKDGTQDQKAGWLITKRGFAFLAGKKVPAKVQTFRNQITERFEDMITIWDLKIDPHTGEGRELLSNKGYDFKSLEYFSTIGFQQPALL